MVGQAGWVGFLKDFYSGRWHDILATYYTIRITQFYRAAYNQFHNCQYEALSKSTELSSSEIDPN